MEYLPEPKNIRLQDLRSARIAAISYCGQSLLNSNTGEVLPSNKKLIFWSKNLILQLDRYSKKICGCSSADCVILSFLTVNVSEGHTLNMQVMNTELLIGMCMYVCTDR